MTIATLFQTLKSVQPPLRRTIFKDHRSLPFYSQTSPLFSPFFFSTTAVVVVAMAPSHDLSRLNTYDRMFPNLLNHITCGD